MVNEKQKKTKNGYSCAITYINMINILLRIVLDIPYHNFRAQPDPDPPPASPSHYVVVRHRLHTHTHTHTTKHPNYPL